MKKRIFLYAYTFNNLGDDLFINVICDRYPETSFFLVAPKNYKKTFHNTPNLKIIPSDSLFFKGINLLGKITGKYLLAQRFFAKRCDAVVFIGGSLFIQGKRWEEQLKLVKAQQIKGKPFYLIGANFGPYQDKNFLEQHKELFQTYTDICFRDDYSYKLFRELPNVRKAPDVIFQLQRPEVVEVNKIIVISVIKPSIRNNFSGSDAIYYQKIKELTIYLVDQGYHVCLTAFCEYEGDDEAIHEIIAQLPNTYAHAVRTHFYKSNLNETLILLAKATYIIACRFHAMVLAWVFDKPVFPIVYSKKMTNVMHDVAFEGKSIELHDIHELQPHDVHESLKTNNVLKKNLNNKSAEQFLALDKFIRE